MHLPFCLLCLVLTGCQKTFRIGSKPQSPNTLALAKAACISTGHDVNDHFVDVTDMVQIGSGAARPVDDAHLSRYACYLVAQNGDPRKKPVAFAT